MGKVVTIAGIKGGIGKTTICTNLAVAFALMNKKVLLVDADPRQRSATVFVDSRNMNGKNDFAAIQLEGITIATQIANIKTDYDIVFIDAGATDSASQRAAIVSADIVLSPIQPRLYDLQSVKVLSSMLVEAKSLNPRQSTYIFINLADAQGQRNLDTQEQLEVFSSELNAKYGTAIFEYLNCPITSRIIFADAAVEGLSIFEANPRNEKAIQEMTNLITFISTQIIPVDAKAFLKLQHLHAELNK